MSGASGRILTGGGRSGRGGRVGRWGCVMNYADWAEDLCGAFVSPPAEVSAISQGFLFGFFVVILVGFFFRDLEGFSRDFLGIFQGFDEDSHR